MNDWGNENGNDGFGFGEMKKGMMDLDLRKCERWFEYLGKWKREWWIWIWENENDFEIGEMEMNDGLKTNEYENMIMVNDFKMIGLSFGSTWTIDLWIAELWFQKISNHHQLKIWLDEYVYYDDWW